MSTETHTLHGSECQRSRSTRRRLLRSAIESRSTQLVRFRHFGCKRIIQFSVLSVISEKCTKRTLALCLAHPRSDPTRGRADETHTFRLVKRANFFLRLTECHTVLKFA
jgi:hypothetical protein